MMYINEEAWVVVIDFEGYSMIIEEAIIDFVEENTLFDINSYQNRKYWINCENSFNCNILFDVIDDKLTRWEEVFGEEA